MYISNSFPAKRARGLLKHYKYLIHTDIPHYCLIYFLGLFSGALWESQGIGVLFNHA